MHTLLTEARQLDQAHIHLSLEEVTACSGPEVSMEVDNTSVLIVGDPQGILGQHLRPQPIDSLNIIIILLLIKLLYFIDLYY